MKVTPKNKLETLLEMATKDPVYRPEFYDLLLKSQIFVLYDPARSPGLPSDGEVLTKDTTVSIKEYEPRDGKQFIPFFSSLDALKKSITTQESYLKIDAKTFFKITKGADYVLNPYSNFGKEFDSEEVEMLLSGKIPEENTHTLKKDTELLVGQPKDYPNKLVKALKKYFSKTRDVNEAYLLWVLSPESKDPPHFLVAIDLSSDDERIFQNAITVSKPFLKEDEFVDLMAIKPDHELIKGQKPFYKNSKLNILKNILFGELL